MLMPRSTRSSKSSEAGRAEGGWWMQATAHGAAELPGRWPAGKFKHSCNVFHVVAEQQLIDAQALWS
jgi:hypothetical protein